MYLEEGLCVDTFRLLDEANLTELGFRMGARKLLMHWIKSGAVNDIRATSTSATMSSPPVISSSTVQTFATVWTVVEWRLCVGQFILWAICVLCVIICSQLLYAMTSGDVAALFWNAKN